MSTAALQYLMEEAWTQIKLLSSGEDKISQNTSILGYKHVIDYSVVGRGDEMGRRGFSMHC